jgi:hypothetical protein
MNVTNSISSFWLFNKQSARILQSH